MYIRTKNDDLHQLYGKLNTFFDYTLEPREWNNLNTCGEPKMINRKKSHDQNREQAIEKTARAERERDGKI